MGKLMIFEDIITALDRSPRGTHILFGEKDCVPFMEDDKKIFIDLAYISLEVPEGHLFSYIDQLEPMTDLIIPYLPYEDQDRLVETMYKIHQRKSSLSVFAAPAPGSSLANNPVAADAAKLAFWAIQAKQFKGHEVGKELVPHPVYNPYLVAHRDCFCEKVFEHPKKVLDYFDSAKNEILHKLSPLLRMDH
jgi:hypothetical protein